MPNTNATKEDVQNVPQKPSLRKLYGELAKIRLSLLVVVTTGAGFIMASPLGIDWLMLLWTVLGTTACAGSAAALNQLAERNRDLKMNRTKKRPLPAGHLSRAHAFIFGIVLAYIGVAILSFGANVASAGIALVTILLYILVYTPLKPLTTFNTIVGAVVGALPPLIGWVAASGGISEGGWILAGILFIWQIPHFLALAWMYREDYERGGFKMLPAIDSTGELTARVSVMTSLCLIPLALFMTVTGSTGVLFAIAGSILGAFMTMKSIVFWKKRDDASARRLFFASIIYLPLIIVFMLLDRETIQWIELGTSNV
ncbi:MAG: heme o synthase [Phycisphaerales bacterium]